MRPRYLDVLVQQLLDEALQGDGDVLRETALTVQQRDFGGVPGTAMAAPPPSALQRERQRAADIIRLLTLYRPLLDAYVIDFFAEGLWARLPPPWQAALATAAPPQLAGLLGGRGGPGATWPLSLLAFAAAARALAFPRGRPGGAPRPPCQSARLHPLLRRHVKPKKQHEIRRLGKLLQRLSQATGCDHVVDVGAGQGHLSRFLAFGLGLSVTAVEGDGRLAAAAERFDRELLQELGKMGVPGNEGPPRRRQNPPRHPPCALTPRGPRHVAGRLDPGVPWGEFLLPPDPPGPGPLARNPLGGAGGCEGGRRALVTGLHACGDLSPALLRHFARSPAVAAVASVACCYMKLSTVPQPPGCPPGYPLSTSVAALPGHELSYRAREAACHALEEYEGRLDGESGRLRAHCYRAVLETLIRAADPGMKHPGVQTVRPAGLAPRGVGSGHRLAGFGSRRGHAGPATQGCGFLQPDPAAGPAGGDPHPPRSPALPAGARVPVRPRSSLRSPVLPAQPGAGGRTDPPGRGAVGSGRGQRRGRGPSGGRAPRGAAWPPGSQRRARTATKIKPRLCTAQGSA
ncbi:methyltransferase-like protein 25B isoform X1 [Grus americana]|uniref:methyltransferase-like protein 25B isoform X1 n=1 Tax=Grus americana TaxID=9117 RepID=UPI002408028B|nr:methyltransferase-like protein 25B isoform X1 [Grus americana]